jgi:hypothetical protein
MNPSISTADYRHVVTAELLRPLCRKLKTQVGAIGICLPPTKEDKGHVHCLLLSKNEDLARLFSSQLRHECLIAELQRESKHFKANNDIDLDCLREPQVQATEYININQAKNDYSDIFYYGLSQLEKSKLTKE